MPLTSRGVVGLCFTELQDFINQSPTIKSDPRAHLGPKATESGLANQEKMADESVDLKAASEAAVAKFQLERVLNQGTIPAP